MSDGLTIIGATGTFNFGVSGDSVGTTLIDSWRSLLSGS